jgi:hypothetical protein
MSASRAKVKVRNLRRGHVKGLVCFKRLTQDVKGLVSDGEPGVFADLPLRR